MNTYECFKRSTGWRKLINAADMYDAHNYALSLLGREWPGLCTCRHYSFVPDAEQAPVLKRRIQL